MMQINVNYKSMSALLTQVTRGLPKTANEMTRASSVDLKRYVRNQIDFKRKGLGQGPRHNTPTPLIEYLHASKGTEGHIVWFSNERLARIVERGTQPHAQPNNPIFRQRGHPGAEAMWFWRDAVDNFIADGRVDFFVKKGLDGLGLNK